MTSNGIEKFQVFLPPRRRGILLYGAMTLLLAAGGVACFLEALTHPLGPEFVSYFVCSLILIAPIPILAYRVYVLIQAQYLLSRDGLIIRWGLRREEIPLPDIQWVQLPEDLAASLRLPVLHFTGFLRGKVKTDGLGVVEFMSGDAHRLILISTPQRVVAISPLEMDTFLQAFQAAFESGSLDPIKPFTAVPTKILWGIWSDRFARWLVFAGLIVTLTLLLLVSLLSPTRDILSIGFNSQGIPLPPVPSQRLLLLPVMAIIFFGVDLLVGVLFYGSQEKRSVSYLIWSGSVVTSLLLLAAVIVLF
jgi:hypothetical protein